MKTARTVAERRIVRAAKYLAIKKKELMEAYGGQLPPRLEARLYTFDDEEERRLRDEYLPPVSEALSRH